MEEVCVQSRGAAPLRHSRALPHGDCGFRGIHVSSLPGTSPVWAIVASRRASLQNNRFNTSLPPISLQRKTVHICDTNEGNYPSTELEPNINSPSYGKYERTDIS